MHRLFNKEQNAVRHLLQRLHQVLRGTGHTELSQQLAGLRLFQTTEFKYPDDRLLAQGAEHLPQPLFFRSRRPITPHQQQRDGRMGSQCKRHIDKGV